MTTLSQEQRRSVGCDCTRLDNVWQHKPKCPVPAIDVIVAEKQNEIVDTVFSRAQQTYRDWTLGSMAGTVSTTVLGLAHDLDHPDCADTTVRHLGDWQREWVRAMHPDLVTPEPDEDGEHDG